MLSGSGRFPQNGLSEQDVTAGPLTPPALNGAAQLIWWGKGLCQFAVATTIMRHRPGGLTNRSSLFSEF